MRLFSLQEVQKITQGQLVKANASILSSSFYSVYIDSREVSPGSLFVALPGERTDGHLYLDQAAARGAGAALVRQDRVNTVQFPAALAIIAVSDTLSALQKLAAAHLGAMGALKIAITGSNGKTTTKEILGRILSLAAKTAFNPGNLNSDIGLPLAVFKIEPTHKYCVLEMGMNYSGEMEALARLVKPDMALITNIGTAHIEKLQNKQNIAWEKRQVFQYFDGRQTGFLYEAEPFYQFLQKDIKGKIVSFGPQTTSGFRGAKDLGLEGFALNWEGLQVRFPLLGYYNLVNAAGAVAVARELGIAESVIACGLQQISPLFGRSQIIRSDFTVIQDCYNANPDSTRAAVNFFAKLPWSGAKAVVLGDMLELGEASPEEHSRLGEFLKDKDLGAVFFFGEAMRSAFEVLDGVREKVYWTDNIEQLIESVARQLTAGDIVLVKGSRGVRLERLTETLLSRKGINSGAR